MNFTATRPGALVAITSGNQAINLANLFNIDPNLVAGAPDVLLDNRSGLDCYVLFGGPDVAVTSGTGVRVPAGGMQLLGKGSALYLGVIGGGAGSLMVHIGEGA